MTYKITVDMRETALIRGLEEAGASDICVRDLALGDVHITTQDHVCRAIVERKTLLDLASSIHDGRYREQGHRLSQAGIEPRSVFYLLEGRLSTYKPTSFGRPITTAALRSATASLQVSKGFQVHTTESTNETVAWLLALRAKIEKSDSNDEADTTHYADVAHRKPSNMVNRDNIDELMLSVIPGVSGKTARGLIAEFGSLRKLVDAMQMSEDALTGLKCGSKRAIGKNTIKRLYELLGPPPTDP